jgi:hypothetical protein
MVTAEIEVTNIQTATRMLSKYTVRAADKVKIQCPGIEPLLLLRKYQYDYKQ